MMLKYTVIFRKGVSATEDKTILEELLERSPSTRDYRQKMDRAYHLLSMGCLKEADALFDEILAEEPFNRDARTGKNLIARQVQVEKRLDHVGERARRALLDEPPADGEAPAEPKPGRKNPLRSKKVLAALVIAFVMFCGLAAAFVGTNGFGTETAEDTPTESVEQQ